MKAKLLSAWGYQGDAMNLPVADVETAVPYYVEKMGFEVVERRDERYGRVVIERDGIRMALAENGGDPTQDGCAFEVDDVGALHSEFATNDLNKLGGLEEETRDDGLKYKVFFVIAPDRLCFWFSERISAPTE